MVLLENVCCYVMLGCVCIVVYDIVIYVEIVVDDEGLGVDLILSVYIFDLFMCGDGLCLC